MMLVGHEGMGKKCGWQCIVLPEVKHALSYGQDRAEEMVATAAKAKNFVLRHLIMRGKC